MTRLDDELRLRLQWFRVPYDTCKPWVRGVWRFGCIHLAQRRMGPDDNESPGLSLQDLRPYGLNESHTLPSRQGMTERDGATAVVLFEGAEETCFMQEIGKWYRSRRKHVNTSVQEVVRQVCCTDVWRRMCLIPVAQN